MLLECLDRNRRKRLCGTLIYSLFYVIAFALLEERKTDYYLLETELDEMIPFCGWFILPYLLWFAYIALTLVYFGLFCEDEAEFGGLARSLAFGCTLFLAVSFLFPNGQSLRPHLNGDTLCERLVLWLYRTDTPTNVFPSIHVFNSVACCIAVLRSEGLRERRWIRRGTVILTILITLSTLFLRQHTILDVLGALFLNVCCYIWNYSGSTALAVRYPVTIRCSSLLTDR